MIQCIPYTGKGSLAAAGKRKKITQHLTVWNYITRKTANSKVQDIQLYLEFYSQGE